MRELRTERYTLAKTLAAVFSREHTSAQRWLVVTQENLHQLSSKRHAKTKGKRWSQHFNFFGCFVPVIVLQIFQFWGANRTEQNNLEYYVRFETKLFIHVHTAGKSSVWTGRVSFAARGRSAGVYSRIALEQEKCACSWISRQTTRSASRNRSVCIPILLGANCGLWRSCKLAVFTDAKKQAQGRLCTAFIQILESLACYHVCGEMCNFYNLSTQYQFAHWYQMQQRNDPIQWLLCGTLFSENHSVETFCCRSKSFKSGWWSNLVTGHALLKSSSTQGLSRTDRCFKIFQRSVSSNSCFACLISNTFGQILEFFISKRSTPYIWVWRLRFSPLVWYLCPVGQYPRAFSK